MYRKYLKAFGFQAAALTRISLAVVAGGCKGAVFADSISATADAFNVPPVISSGAAPVCGDTAVSSVAAPAPAAETVSTGTAAVLGDKTGPQKETQLLPEGRNGAYTHSRNGRKQARALRLSENRGSINVIFLIVNAATKKCRIMHAPFFRIKTHATKILFLAGSLILVLITIQFYWNYQERGRFMTTTRLSIMDKEVQRACRYIEEHYSDPALDIESICGALVTGGAFLEALFMKELGLSIAEFIAQVRINRAKIAIRKNPNLEADALARMVGYTDTNEFLARFETITGSRWQSYRDAIANC